MITLARTTFKKLQSVLSEAWHQRNTLPDGTEEQNLLKRAINASDFYIQIPAPCMKALINYFLMYSKDDESLVQFTRAIAKGKFKP